MPFESYHVCFGRRRDLSDSLGSYFGRAVGHVEHPGPDVSLGPGEAQAQAQAEHPEFPPHVHATKEEEAGGES